jgi:hypothetical protein
MTGGQTMWRIVCGLLLLLTACTKPNPNRCCTDEADCMAQGLPTDSQCDDGLLCRGGQCIAQACSSAADCDASAPFCIDASCTEMCTADEQCPGFGGAANQTFCQSGTCVQCRAASNADCSGATPVCDAGACRACSAHSECASGACAADGSCAVESEIAYVEPGGSDSADCSRATKCSLAHGASLGRRYIVLSPGTFTLSSPITFVGTVSLIGSGTTKPEVTCSVAGGIFKIGPGANVWFENLRVRGATGTNNIGSGIYCGNVPSGARHVYLTDVDLTQNAYYGFFAQQCTVEATRSNFTMNGFDGFSTTDSEATIERCAAYANVGDGFNLDVGLYRIRNTFSYRNGAVGIDLYGNAGSTAEFNTVVDNPGGGLLCEIPGLALPNNIDVRNGTVTTGGNCTYPGSILASNVTGLNFKSPDTQPYDYHLTPGSLAIDMAIVSAVADDFDGDARPQGAGRDVGADEFKP